MKQSLPLLVAATLCGSLALAQPAAAASSLDQRQADAVERSRQAAEQARQAADQARQAQARQRLAEQQQQSAERDRQALERERQADERAQQAEQRARQAAGRALAVKTLQDGKALPLPRILDIVAARVSGPVAQIHMEGVDNVVTYEVDVLKPDGNQTRVSVDAVTGQILGVRG